MAKSSKGLCLFLIMLMMIIGMVKVNGRFLALSDGVHDDDIINENDQYDTISLSTSVNDSKRCESIYGFLPCGDTMQEGVFLIVMYGYVMMLGEEWLGKGSAALLVNFGDLKVAGSVFRVLMALPTIVMVIVSGVLSTQSDARGQVAFSVAMYAGSTLITLTGIWGVNIILNREKLRRLGKRPSKYSEEHSSSTPFHFKQIPSYLTETGVEINKDTRKMAFIVLLSLIPFAVVLLVPLFTGRAMILVALILSTLSFFSYIAYQIANPWIQNRSLAYLKEEHFQKNFLKKLQLLTNESLYIEGKPNIEAIKSIFNIADLDANKILSRDELEKLIQEKLNIEEDEISKSYAEEEILTHFETDGVKGLTMKEFQDGCTRWLNKWSAGKANQANAQNLWDKLVTENGIEELAKLERIMPRILFKLLLNHKIVSANGEIDEEQIEELFRLCDTDMDGSISCEELEKAILNLHLGDEDLEVAATDMMNEFDTSEEGRISKKEFVTGLKTWINKAKDRESDSKDLNTVIRKFAIDAWDTVNTTKEPKRNMLYAFLGIATIYLSSGPFMQSVIQFSNALHIPFLFTSYVVAPLFMNSRSIVIFAFSSSSRATTKKNGSLAFFELYGGLVMNNLMGLTTLLTIVYVKGLTWDYTAEVVTIVVIGACNSVFALVRNTYPLWTCSLSFLLYVLTISLFCVYAWERV